jgi:hypothetical protein
MSATVPAAAPEPPPPGVRTRRRPSTRTVAVVVGVAVLVAAGLVAWVASVRTCPPVGAVSGHGYTVRIPDGWRVDTRVVDKYVEPPAWHTDLWWSDGNVTFAERLSITTWPRSRHAETDIRASALNGLASQSGTVTPWAPTTIAGEEGVVAAREYEAIRYRERAIVVAHGDSVFQIGTTNDVGSATADYDRILESLCWT